MNDIYLDHAATSFPKPECVYQQVENFMRHCGASPARGSYRKAQEAERIVLNLRSTVAKVFGILNPSNVIFTTNATDALNLALKGYLRTGDHVVTTDLEHNALLRPLWRLRQTRQIEVSIVKSNVLGEIAPEDIVKAIRPNTRLVACVHASNVLGTIQPIRQISEKTRSLGIPLLVDGSQTAGSLPIDVEELGIDLFAFTGHKSLLGLPGTGGLYIRDGLDLEPLREGGTGSRSESLDQPHTRPEKFESGTPNTFGLVGLLAGIQYIEETGIQSIRTHEILLNQELMHQLKKITGVTVYGPEADSKVAITSMNIHSLPATEVGQILGKKFGVMVRTGIHCSPLLHQNLGTQESGTVRFSLGWSNTRQEVDTVVAAVREIAQAVYNRQEPLRRTTPCITL